MIEVIFDYSNEQEDVAVPDTLVQTMRRAAASVLKNEGLSGTFEISLTIADKPSIKALNADYRGIDSVTDVLSFPLSDTGDYPENPANGARLLGDIVICAARAEEQAAQFGHSVERECGFLCAHSVLHLLGYDHVHSEAEAAVMEAKQEKALQDIGLVRNSNLSG